jgi:hypothetical protein
MLAVDLYDELKKTFKDTRPSTGELVKYTSRRIGKTMQHRQYSPSLQKKIMPEEDMKALSEKLFRFLSLIHI